MNREDQLRRVSQPFSDYLVFVDESGDHGLASIDPHYPVFSLAFCVFAKDAYTRAFTPTLQEFKLRHFGHENVVLHEHDIRKDTGAFRFLASRKAKDSFVSELTTVIADAPFTLGAIIRKASLREQYGRPENPYHLALGFGLERVHSLLTDLGTQTEQITHVIVERRGKQEDMTLEEEFARVRGCELPPGGASLRTGVCR